MPRWKMLAGKFYYRGNKFVAGDVFEAPTEEVKSMRDILQPLDAVEDYAAQDEKDVPRNNLLAIHKGRGLWDVVNTTTDKKLNDRPLTKAEAQQLVDKEVVEEEVVEEEVEPAEVVDEEAPPIAADTETIPEKKQSDKWEKIVIDEPRTTSAGNKAKAAGDTKPVERKHRVPAGRRPKLK